MSRTDAHRPGEQHLREASAEQHDHRSGRCDLPTLQDWIRLGGGAGSACRWELPQWYTASHPLCGCPLCTQQAQHRQDRRRDRAAARRDTARAHRNHPGGAEDR